MWVCPLCSCSLYSIHVRKIVYDIVLKWQCAYYCIGCQLNQWMLHLVSCARPFCLGFSSPKDKKKKRSGTQDYCRHKKIRRAKHSQFQPHWSFCGNTFMLPWPEVCIFSITYVTLCSLENFCGTLDNRENRKSLARLIFPHLQYVISKFEIKYWEMLICRNCMT